MFKSMIKKELSEMRKEVEGEIKKDIEDLCRGLVYELFADERDQRVETWGTWGFYGTSRIDTLRGDMKKLLKNTVSKKAKKECGAIVDDTINGEKFIDTIVKRILDKQLP